MSSTPATPPGSTAPFTPEEYRAALGQFATGVTIVTARAADGRLLGLTANSFNSVSLSPPLVLWSLGLHAGSLPLFHAGTHYVINVLAADQLELCQRFAYGKGDRFAGVDYTLGQSGLPILGGALAWFECHNRSRYEEGDHVIFVGEVERCGFADGDPLVFQAGQFGTTRTLQP